MTSHTFGRIMGALASTVLAAALLAACSSASAKGDDSPPQESIGTLRATVDGEQRTWYALQATVDGQREPSVMWMDGGDGARSVVVGGYDRVDVPFDTFRRDPESGLVTSFGDFEGGVLVLNFDVPAGADAPLEFSPEGSDDPSVVLVPSVTDYGAMFALESGSIRLETLDFERGRFTGTFEAELATMDGSRTVRITDGTFEVEGGRPAEEIVPGGR